jgi:hypothetical protein
VTVEVDETVDVGGLEQAALEFARTALARLRLPGWWARRWWR